MTHSNSATPLHDLARALFRHRGRAFRFFVMVVVAVTVATLLWPKSYQSRAKLLVRLGRENAKLDPTITLEGEPTFTVPESKTELNSVVEVLRSRFLLEAAVNRLGAETVLARDDQEGLSAADADSTFARWLAHTRSVARTSVKACESWLQDAGLTTPVGDVENAIRKLEKSVNVASVKDSSVIVISHRAKDPRRAQSVVAALVACYTEESARMSRRQQTHAFLAGQKAGISEELGAKEVEFRQLKNETGITSPDEQRTALVARLARLQDELLDVSDSLAAMEAEVNGVEEMLTELPQERVTSYTEGFSDEGTNGMREQLYALKTHERQLNALYTPTHPQLQVTQEKLEESKKLLEEEQLARTRTTTAINPAYQAAELALVERRPAMLSFEVRSEVLHEQLVAVQGELKTFNEDERRLAALQREVELLDMRYRNYCKSVDQARVDEDLAAAQMSNVYVVQPATLEETPASPRSARNLLLGLAAALFGAIGIALLSEQGDTSLRTREDIEDGLDVPLLASIPRLSRQRGSANRNVLVP